MALWTRQLSRYCLLLNAYNTMKSSELRKQSIKTWRCFLEPPDLQQLCPNRYFCQMLLKNFRILHLDNHMLFCSSSSGTSQTSLSFTDKPKTEIVSSLDTDVLLQDLEDELPLSALEEISENEALQIKAAPPPPLESFSLRDYIDHSETLRKLVLLGVDLSRVEKRPNAGQLLVKLDFENDIKKILLFLKDIGLEDTQLGAFLTKNPYILNEEVEDLKTRVNYLISKKFTKEAITQMVFRAPYLLLFSVERLDNRLGYFQNELGLNPRKTRNLVIRLPRLLTGKLEPIKENLKVYELELGFSKNEIRHIAHTVPKNLSTSKIKLTQMFDYLHNVMGIPHKLMVLFPQIFNAKLLRIKERHLFLKFLGRAQYDPGQPSYISLEKLVVLPDDVFCADVAKAEVKDFEKFLKTL
ncbi:transcription termination factor 3, mitochondrial isoform X1 [Python bivittatus]|uniref:Transcription termination factor 3, mitochondrial n=1 Tax=Python bivittatus TaxID=176946 RepID=A0A9F5IF37_PYTBI|nr:transcription termination factor 3, mitochondrial isoform X1 [Python bivittatus]XP_025022822.1 transcription termination factor 3, mitochondrial isoform X1 [Python bivittatus]XP_025022823.1 transcription termination factor 3, mitochondrial isoform X1 [Python bivittatus]XP_025022824.1 transcription termination factor 3, mitochondrial isoform X1 [Python bivittatus]XP_025022826.1 transcription termination factor 3, mitochondrial isoform X1 [Python bivittatus]